MPGSSSAAKTVVVADDTAFVRDRFKAALEHAGHHVVTVQSAPELLEHVQAGSGTIDLLLLDLRLSNASGTDLVRQIRKLDEGRVPILIFSGTIGSADDVRALAAMRVAGYVNEYSAAQHIVPSVAPHLFPDRFNRRGSPRVVLGIPVQYRVGNTIAAALSLNLGHRGIAIRTTSPLDHDTKLRVRFRLPGATADIDAEGRVSWSHPRVGMGVQLELVDAASQAQIDTFVDTHFFSNRKA